MPDYSRETLKLLPRGSYVGVNGVDPIRLYYWPVLGNMYRRRVELCLEQCAGGQKILEVGFGSGVSFSNLSERYREVHGLDLTADVAKITESFAARGTRLQLLNGSVLAMPYADNTFDSVLLISILEHLEPEQQVNAFTEISRVLKPAGRVVYGVPVERKLMVLAFRMLGYDIREHHFSTEHDVAAGARAASTLKEVRRVNMFSPIPRIGAVYQVGVFEKIAEP